MPGISNRLKAYAANKPRVTEANVAPKAMMIEFRKRLMQEHFNENYMESDKYPRATINGTLGAALQLADGASETFTLSGALDIHGVTRDVEIPVVMVRAGDTYKLSCDFIVESEAHDIEVPRMLFKKIAKEVQVTVALTLEPGG